LSSNEEIVEEKANTK